MSEMNGIDCVSDLDVCKVQELSTANSWVIQNYSGLCAVRKKFRSPSFTAGDDDLKWSLEHKISRRQDEDYVSFVLLPVSDDNFKKYDHVSGNLKISLSNNGTDTGDFKPMKEGTFKISCDGPARRFELCFCTLSTCMDNRHRRSFDRLHVVCNLKYLKTTLWSSNPFKTIQCSLSRDLERIHIEEDFSDVTISVKNKNYPVHKAILAARSSVFRAMFKSNMRESQKNHITVTDIDQDVFQEMLHYIYTGKTKNLEVLAFELLPAADKYDLKDLKTMCEEALFKRLAPDNALKILILADMYHAKKLKTLAIRYIKRNAANCKDFKSDEILKVLKTSRPQLMADICWLNS
ncbi:speckle-type POZ protein B-like [Planococcus citri]|uniref:speckle-type POZ protein B-like n=1 Tax=Planococcus citri TaxID=170843 RepID=UPI0031F731A7